MGHILYKSGWLEQGGYSDTIPGSGALRISYYKSFNGCLGIFLTNWENLAQPANVTTSTNTYFEIDYQSASLTGRVKWVAFGHAA